MSLSQPAMLNLEAAKEGKERSLKEKGLWGHESHLSLKPFLSPVTVGGGGEEDLQRSLEELLWAPLPPHIPSW